MQALDDIISSHTALEPSDRDWLARLVREWHLLSDTSFSDLVLWLPDTRPSIFWAAAQIRPNTGPTAIESDIVGESISYEPDQLVTEAYLTGEICETSDHSLSAGIPVGVSAIPIRRQGRCIAIVERHTNQLGVRAPGALEDCYLEIAAVLSNMLWRGEFPTEPPSVASISPKVGDGLIRTNAAGLVTYASPNAMSAYRKLGLSTDLIGEPFEAVTAALATAEVVAEVSPDGHGRRAQELTLDLPQASIRLRILPLDLDGQPAGAMVLSVDATALRNRERELITKDATIREIHHRIKNNLQTVAALLRMQSRRMDSDEAKAALKEAVSRVQSIAVVHDILSRSYDEMVPFDQVVDQLMLMVGDVAAPMAKVSCRRDGSFGLVSADISTALSLAITELCQNAIEHGFAGTQETVVVRPIRSAGQLRVEVRNNGLPLDAGFDAAATNSLGLSIVATLVEDLNGTFSLFNEPDEVVAQIDIPLNGE